MILPSNRKTSLAPRQTLRVMLASAMVVLGAGCQGSSKGPPPTSASADTLRVMAYNIHHGEGMDEELDLERIAALIREVDPDLVTLQEVDSVTSRTMGVDQVAELGRLTGLQSVFGRFMAYQGGAYGMALLSAWSVAESVNYRLPDGEEPRTALAAIVTSPKTGRSLRFVGIHFYRTAEERLAQAVALEGLLGDDTIPTILAVSRSERDSCVRSDNACRRVRIPDLDAGKRTVDRDDRSPYLRRRILARSDGTESLGTRSRADHRDDSAFQ